jgi:hypothetical protein
VQKRSGRARNEHGNILSMTFLVAGVLLFICVLAFCGYMILSEHIKGQGDTDKTVLDIAKVLNDRDRIGKVNNIVARNRELVFLSRQSVIQASNKNQEHWAPLANYLLDEARASQTLVEHERKSQIELSRKSVRDFVEQFNLRTTDKPSLKLPGWQSAHGDIVSATLGSVRNVQSNVKNTTVFPDLRDFDEHEKYFQKGSDLYLGGIDAKLPVPDNDLNFKFASLAAPVEKTVAPARMINPDVFVPFGDVYLDHKAVNRPITQLPDAIKIVRKSDMTIATGDKQSTQETSVAVSNGAAPIPGEEE